MLNHKTIPATKTNVSSIPNVHGGQDSVLVKGLYFDGSAPLPKAAHSAVKTRAGSLLSSASITSNLLWLSWPNDLIIRLHAKQRMIPLRPSTTSAGPAMLFAVPSRMRSPVAARMMELTERKNVLTCCRRETRASEVPTRSLYCSSSIGTSVSLGDID